MKLLTLTVSGLAILQGALSQTTTLDILPVPPGFDAGELQGKLLGTGPDGTTFVVSAVVSGTPVTETLVKDATHVSEFAVINTGGVDREIRRQCSYNDQNVGTCSVGVEATGGLGGIQSSGPATISFAPVAVEIGTSSAVVADNTSTGSASVADNTGTGSASGADNTSASSTPAPGDNNSNSASALPYLTACIAIVPIVGFLVTL